ncbi:iron complex outermembrane recepter protein [Sinomicrobium oceani]|uniref:Iron complex outermembrane recepter protein n=1 Tax=Sinomicrobium oceani TaxID=1150368 RepID=A0A1K1QRD7_9FLAO|nr:TonB-dependent receptor [Sinomicrobium oceani]SFW62506.1 iron complex outermembrane recepter protein [Sinomicrobium oceani]
MKKKIITVFSLAALLFTSLSSVGQDKQTTLLDEVIVSTDSLSIISKDSSLIIGTPVVNRQQLDQYGPTDVTWALNQLPGVYMLSGGMNVNRITMRGVGARTPYGSNKVRAYLNDIPVTNAIGETSIEIFDPENIDQVEVIQGPKAVNYGTNLGGALLFRSGTPSGSYIRNSFTTGSYDLIKNTTNAVYSDKKLSVNAGYEHLETKGYRENSAYRRNAVFLNATYRPDSKNAFTLLLNQINYNAQISSSIGRTALEENPRQAASNWLEAQGYKNSRSTLAGLSYTHRFSSEFRNTTSVFYTYLDHYEPRPFNILTGFTNGYGIRSTFRKDFDFAGQKATVYLGTELYKDQYNWQTIENRYQENNGNGSLEGQQLSRNKEYRSQVNLFASLSLPLARGLKAQVGLNSNFTSYNFLDHYHTGEDNTSASRRFDPIVAPSLNLDYQYDSNLRFYANVSRGFSFPGTEETLTPEGVINPDLGPEKGMHYEAGSHIKLWKERLRLSVAAYLMDIKDLLVAQRVGEDQYIGRNAGKTEHKGIEVSAEYHWAVSRSLLLIPFINTSINDHRFIRFRDGDNNHSGNNLTGVPDNKTNAGLRIIHRSGLYFYANYQHIGEIPLTDANNLYTDPYGIANVKAGYKHTLSEKFILEISGGINNLSDKNYAQSVLINAVGFGNSEPRFYYPGLPRNFYGGIQFRYLL